MLVGFQDDAAQVIVVIVDGAGNCRREAGAIAAADVALTGTVTAGEATSGDAITRATAATTATRNDLIISGVIIGAFGVAAVAAGVSG